MIFVFFWKTSYFGGKMGVAATLAPKGLGHQNPTRKLAHWVDLIGQPISRESVSKFSGPNLALKSTLSLSLCFIFCLIYGVRSNYSWYVDRMLQLIRCYWEGLGSVFQDFPFSARFGGEMGVAATWAPKGLVPENSTINYVFLFVSIFEALI